MSIPLVSLFLAWDLTRASSSNVGVPDNLFQLGDSLDFTQATRSSTPCHAVFLSSSPSYHSSILCQPRNKILTPPSPSLTQQAAASEWSEEGKASQSSHTR